MKLTKDVSGTYSPDFTLNQFRKKPDGSTTVRTLGLLTTTRITEQQMLSKGMDIQLDLNLATGTTSSLTVNGTQTTYANRVLGAPINDTQPTLVTNQLGGTLHTIPATAYVACYLNYELSDATRQLAHTFSFDDVTSATVINNAPKNNLNIPMVVAPYVSRLLGPCLLDTDQDGIYDLYEDLNHNNDLSDDDTDGDSLANYEDADDDGDGIATWHVDEGGSGIIDNAVLGLAYMVDTDRDLIVNYLDAENLIYNDPPLVSNYFLALTGDKRYELSNHLGNVLSVLSDRKIPLLNGGDLESFNADVLSYSDYYPFGMLVPNRHASFGSYRYGFQGQEKDDELKGEGNSLNYQFRMHDPRVGRFFSIDALSKEYPELTPYQFASNSPIAKEEIEGLEGGYAIDKGNVSYVPGPRIDVYNSETAAKASLNKAQSVHSYPQNTPMLSQDTRTFSQRATQKRAIQRKMAEDAFNKQVYENPSLMLAQGVYIGLQEAPGVIAGEMIVDKVAKSYTAIKAIRQSKMASRVAKSADELESGVASGTRVFEDASYVKAPLELQAPKISNVSTKVDMGKQGKHIVGHNNYKTQVSNGNSPSILEADAQKLLNNFQSGNVVNSTAINDVKTRVDFGTTIGQYYNPSTGAYTPTTNGIIHNSKSGAHIVPAAP